MSRYPLAIRSIHQIEVTTHCNLRCVYCPSRELELPKWRGAPKTHMDVETFEKALEWCKAFEANDTQGELSITGIGETLLHPEWKTLIRLAREALPRNFINFSTNGLLLDDDAAAYLYEHRVGVFVSMHRPEKAGPAIVIAKKHEILVGTNSSAADSSFDWAGQLEWGVTASALPCGWLQNGWGAVLVDGRITTCCLDASAKGVVGHVDETDKIGTLGIRPFELCSSCHLTVPE